MSSSILKNMYTEKSLEDAALLYAASKGDETAKEKVKEMNDFDTPTIVEMPAHAEKENRHKPVIAQPLCQLSMEELWTRVEEEKGCTLPIFEEIITRLKKKQNNNEELKAAYEKLLVEFPMCYGYWIRLAKLHATWEERENVYQRGLGSTEVNPQLWQSYLREAIDHHGKSNTQLIRDIMDRAIEHCGGHWLSWELWRCCLDFEEAELRRVAEDLSRPNEKLSLEQTTIARLREFYRTVLQTPHKQLTDAWHKFESLLLADDTASSSGGACRQLQQEYDAFQAFVVDHYELQTAHGCSWEKSFLKELKRLNKNVECVSKSDIRVRFPDHGECALPAGTTACDLRAACSSCGEEPTAVELLVDGRVWHCATSTAVLDLLPAHSTVVVFDAPAISKALSLSSEKAVEKWFLTRRAALVTETSAKAIERELYEKKLSRTYYHPNPLTVGQLNAWRKYLDFMQAQGDSVAYELALRRSVEVCCDYSEFWRRAIRFAGKRRSADSKEAAKALCLKAVRLFGHRRPDLIFLYVDFLDKQGDAEEAKKLTEELLSWGWPVLSDECVVRLLRVSRAGKQLDRCAELLAMTRQPHMLPSARLCIVRANHALAVDRDKEGARSALQEGWRLRPCRSILKQLLWLLQNHFTDTNITILALYSQALHNTKHFDALDRWHIWKDLIFYAQHHCDIQTLTQLQERFADFQQSELPSRVKRPAADEGNATSGKKMKEDEESTALPPCLATVQRSVRERT
eukprot:GHVS01040907.1.p1 GENE.GHVS01040907.1~~GHVS01040907.1.p1  ORF type:complete len:744 (+),score=149.29 GHVS01040907.1:313-2544(+)